MNFINSSIITEATKIREDLEFKLIKYDEKFSYIQSTPVFENFELFIDLCKKYPVVESLGFELFNPTLKQYFYQQHVKTLKNSVEEFLKNIFSEWDLYVVGEFANIYTNKDKFYCPVYSVFPHVDSAIDDQIAVNFWISSNDDDATSIWQIDDSYFYTQKNEKYIDNCSVLYAEENNINAENVEIFNLEDYKKIKKILDIPTIPNTVTMYFSNIWHSPKWDKGGAKLRWSYAMFYKIIKKK